MVICKNCGFQLPDNTKICTECHAIIDVEDEGAVQGPDADSLPEFSDFPGQPQTNFYGEDTIRLRDKKVRTKSRLIFIIIILISAVVLFFIFSAMFRSSEGFGGLFGGIDVTLPDDVGDISEIAVSNAANHSGVAMGNDCYYTTGGGGRSKYEIRKYTEGSSDYETLYSSDTKISDLGYYDGVFYFLAPNGSKTNLYSLKEGAAVPELRVSVFDINGLFIYGSNAYYIVNGYGATKRASILNRIDLNTGQDDIISSLENADISTVIEYRGNLYVHYMSRSDYTGHLKMSSVEYPNALTDVSTSDSRNEDIYNITAGGGMVFLSNVNHLAKSRETYSMKPDGSDMTRIADSGGTHMCVYGDYLFYIKIYSDFKSASYTYETRRMNTDGSDDVLISVRQAINPGIADRKMFYTEPEEYHHAWMSLDGRHEGQ